MRIIGDVHAKIDKYAEIINSCGKSICVGDFGFKNQWDWLTENKISTDHQIVMGNHDYIPYRESHRNSLGTHSFNDDIFTIAGASSIDKHLRTHGVDWFEDEELPYLLGVKILEWYNAVTPSIVITHDCPQFVASRWFGIQEKSRTRQLLDALFEVYEPELWIFGHHHKSKTEQIDRTKFICLSELEYIDLP